MDFRLTYEGPLRGNGSADHKHEIRKVFHKQLKRLWEIYPSLVQWNDDTILQHPGLKRRSDVLGDSYARCGYRFVPLACDPQDQNRPHDLPPLVSLDVLFLRSGPPGGILKSADIDNRLKTLFDALRMPTHLQELGQYTTPAEGEDPFFVLMEDDRLVSNVSVVTDMLLEPTQGAELYDKNDARLIVAISVRSVHGVVPLP